ncbi:MAG TPA: N-formylglutamate amidohydrolase [Actinomycetota bacterium]|nr:N-formylglutamate amidohydrolase [Actinomycetota bacterium]
MEYLQFEVLGEGRIPLIGHVPHCGTKIPPNVERTFVLTPQRLAEEITRVTDHLTDKLFAGVVDAGGTMFINSLSRLVVDPERFRDDDLEPMASRGAGVVYTTTSDLVPLRGPVNVSEREELLSRYYDPYAKALTELVAKTLDRHGYCMILDCHSFPTTPLGYAMDQSGERPEICIGTDPFHTPKEITRVLAELCLQQGRHVAVDQPYSGTYVPQRFFQKERNVQAVMIEVRRDLYIDELTGKPTEGWAETRSLVDQMIQSIC